MKSSSDLRSSCRVLIPALAILFGAGFDAGEAYAQSVAAHRYTAEPSSQYLRGWLICGPFSAGKELSTGIHLDGFDADPLMPGGEMKASPRAGDLVAYDGGERVWNAVSVAEDFVSLDDAVSDAEYVFAYAYAEIETDDASTSVLAFGSNDGARVWLNGEVIWDYASGRPLRQDSDFIPVVLRKGLNRLLIKIEERGNRWGFAARFLPFDEELLAKLDLFSVETPRSEPPRLVFRHAPTLIGTFVTDARFSVRPATGTNESIWSRTLDAGRAWDIDLGSSTYAPYVLSGELRFADGSRRALEQPFWAGERTEHVLFENGKTDYSIILDADASESERWAASELQHWLKEVSGAEFAIGNAPSQGAGIYVGFGREARKLLGGGVKAPMDSDESFTIQNVDSSIVIWGGRDRGTMYGVMEFLESELGVRWYTRAVTVAPKKTRYAFDYVYRTESPGIRVRNDFYFEAFDSTWAARNRMNGVMGLREQPGGVEGYWAVHTFYPLVPPDEFFASHPEYYSLIDGKRTTERAQLCLTNPEVLNILTDRLLKVMDEQPGYLIYCVSQNDWYGACQCGPCQEIAQREGSEAGPIIWFVNQVAERVEKKHPDKFVGTLAYQYTRRPPKTIEPRENVVVRLCSIECCFAHDFASCPENVEFLEDLKGWSAIAPHLYIWDYVVNFSNYVMPYPNFQVLQPNIQMFRDNKAIGIMEQAAYQSRGGEFAELRAYVLAKLLWDPECGVQEVIDDFMYGFYERSGQFVREYFDLLHAQITPDTHIHLGLQADDALFTDAFVRKADAIFDEAERVANNEEVLRRVEMTRLPLMFLKCRRDASSAVADGTYARFKAITEREGVTHYQESGGREGFHQALDEVAAR